MGMAFEVETAEREYLRARVENLLRIEGNPHGARIFSNNGHDCFYVRASSSPMHNRIYGDSAAAPHAILDLLAQSTAFSTVTPLIAKPGLLEPFPILAGRQLEQVKGWAHLQFIAAIQNTVPSHHGFAIEEVTTQALPAFADLHASGFHTRPGQRAVNQASFMGKGSSGSLRLYVIKENEQVIAGASMYVASNGITYLGTAVTRKDARSRGCHSALISHRIALARELDSDWVAATALANSRSRRNLQRAGLEVSHAQALYRLKES